MGSGHPKTRNKLAGNTHLVLYALMIMMPLSGVVMIMSDGNSIGFFGLFSIPSLIPESITLHDLFMLLDRQY